MAEAKSEFAWTIASHQMALLANCNRDSKSKAFKPDDFHPYRFSERQSEDIEITKDNISLMRNAFVNGSKKR